MTNEQAKEIANTIAQQMGGTGRLSLMVNAKNITYDSKDGAFSFKFMKGSKKINFVRVRLDLATDTYTMEFAWIYSARFTVKKTIEGVYCDQLISIFEDTTQLALIMGRVFYK